jgi:hypothetical protein
MKKLFLSILSLVSISAIAQDPTITLTQVGSGFSTVTCLASAGDNRLFVLEQAGRIKFFDPYAGGANTTFMDISSRVNSTGNERGLLGLAFAPDFATSGRFYVNYTAASPSGSTVISRFSVSSSNPNAGDPNSEEILMTISQPYSNHNGGNIMFGPDGYLYIGMGDGGSGGDPQGNAQNTQSYLGKMLRIDVSGQTGYTSPTSNPFVGANDPNNTTLDEIWAIGVRNPWRYSFDRLTGDLWIGDVGQNLWEEVDFQPASSTGGENYGWKCYESNATYSTSGCLPSSNYVFPVFEFDHSSANGCSITGGFVNRGVVNDNLYGRYLVTDYCSGRIWSLMRDELGVTTSIDHGQFNTNSYTAFGQDNYGEIYLARQNGIILRIGASNSVPLAMVNTTEAFICPGASAVLSTPENPLLTYAWYKDADVTPSATGASFEATEEGTYYVEITRTSDGASNASEEITVTVAPEPPILTTGADPSELCDDAAFPVSLIGNPIGGTFSGTGVVNASFDPFDLSAGEYEITYNYTTAEGCVAEPVSFIFTINALPEVSISGVNQTYCEATEIAVMPILTPAGGELSGPGVSNNIFTPSVAGIGSHTLSYNYADDNGCAGFASITVEVESCLGINALANKVVVRPNPVTDVAFFQLSSNNSKQLSVSIIDALGRVAIPANNITVNESGQFSISMSSLSAGVYMVLMNDGSKMYSSRLIKN